MTKTLKPWRTIPRLDRIRWLVHGFGTADWAEADFLGFAERAGLRPVLLDQIHSDIIHRVRNVPGTRLRGDALITDKPGLVLAVKTADCLPALIVDEVRRTVAAVHSGWRGTRQRILEKTIRALKDDPGSDPAALWVALGPCIGASCYEVGTDVRESFAGAGFPDSVFEERASAPGRFLLDLREANLHQLDRAGVRRDRVFSLDACTHCRPELISYRRDGGRADRMFAFIGIRPEPVPETRPAARTGRK
jgi:polyphenol oxidase